MSHESQRSRAETSSTTRKPDMVKLTDKHGETIWICPPHVRCIRAAMVGNKHGALLEFTDGDSVTVTDPPGEVAQAFEQWFRQR